jgi:hypothetical protein
MHQCGYELSVGSTKHLPPCPKCGSGGWETLTGGDSKDDPLAGGPVRLATSAAIPHAALNDLLAGIGLG